MNRDEQLVLTVLSNIGRHLVSVIYCLGDISIISRNQEMSVCVVAACAADNVNKLLVDLIGHLI